MEARTMINTQVKNPYRKAFYGTSNKVSPLALSNGVSMSKDTCGCFSGFDSHHSGSQNTGGKSEENDGE